MSLFLTSLPQAILLQDRFNCLPDYPPLTAALLNRDIITQVGGPTHALFLIRLAPWRTLRLGSWEAGPPLGIVAPKLPPAGMRRSTETGDICEPTVPLQPEIHAADCTRRRK